MRYVGFSEFYHDGALSVINEDGTIEFASHGERFSKRKNDPVIPDSLWDDYTTDKDHISFYEDIELRKKHREKWDSTRFKEVATITHTASLEVPNYNVLAFDQQHEHHQSHCASAFYTRPWEDKDDTVLVSIDGAGEVQCAVIYDSNFNLIKQWQYPKSVGMVYTTCTKELGLRPLEDEYVVMGLSSYGSPISSLVNSLMQWYTDIPYMNPDYLIGGEVDTGEGKMGIHAMTRIIRDAVEQYDDAEVAASVQAFAEWAILDIMKEARKHGRKLCYSGGCAQNVVINSMIKDMFDDVHIAVSPTDAGSSLGTAAMSWAEATGKDRLVWTPYLGYNIKGDVNPKEVVQHLLDNKVCGLANGKAEFGPRALGNRSLIADVRYDVKDTVNTIKRRQKYRTFAPAILEEFADEYFDGHMNEYMQYTSTAKHDYASVTHVDGTARVQVVKKDCESIFRKVIEEYYEKTGVPMLLNTSLNIRGRPMVNDEHDARLWEQKYGVKVF